MRPIVLHISLRERHQRIVILVTYFYTVIFEADNQEEVQLYGEVKQAQFKTFLALP